MKALRTLVAIAALAAAAPAQWLHDPVAFPAGDQPGPLAAGDLDGDGRNDLVTLNVGTSFGPEPTFTIMLGSAGSLDFGTTVPAGSPANDLALGDVTGDGALDVVTVHGFTESLDVHAGDGLGGLLTPVHAGTHGPSVKLALGDLDLDGWLDAVTGNSTFGIANASIMHNTAGTLAATAIQTLPGPAQRIVIAPLDGDALPDVLLSISFAAPGNGVMMLKGLGGGAVSGAVAAYGPVGIALAPADLDADGDLDAVQARTIVGGFASFDALLNDGAGLYALHSSLPTSSKDPRDVVAADFDLDGAPDAAMTCFAHNVLRTARGDGAGGMAAGPLAILPDGPISAIAADLSGDGRPDVAVAMPVDDAVLVLFANDVRLDFAPTTSVAAGDAPFALRLCDVDGGGTLDALVVGNNDQLRRLSGTGTGGFGAPVSFPTGDGPAALDVGDLDGDGDLDAVVAANNADAVDVLLGDGAGGFGAPAETPALNLAFSVFVRDFDADGRPDVLVGSPATAGLLLFPGDGAGGLLAAATLPVPAGTSPGVGDLDGDFVPEIVTGYGPTSDVQVWLNDGSGQFAPQTPVRTGQTPTFPIVRDFDDDGLPDVAVVSSQFTQVDGWVAVLSGDGAGGLAPPLHVTSPGLGSLAAGELNGDGRPDLLGTSLGVIDDGVPVTSFTVLHVVATGEDGELQAPSPMADLAGHSGLDTGDLDGDGRRDVVMGDQIADVLLVALNASEPHPWSDVGSALAGTNGPPRLLGVGWAQVGTAGSIKLLDARALALAVLFVSPFSTPTPFKGGVLLPVPPALGVPLLTDAHGTVILGWSSWPPLASGETWWMQAAVSDPVAPHGAALSNGIRLLQP